MFSRNTSHLKICLRYAYPILGSSHDETLVRGLFLERSADEPFAVDQRSLWFDEMRTFDFAWADKFALA